MKWISLSWLGFLVTAVTSAAEPDPMARLGWMAGCWGSRTATKMVEEYWIVPSGGLMMGMSRTVIRDTAREFEQLRIESLQGTPTYVAHPSGQREAAFPAIAVSDTAVLFANPAHDFPQRIGYRRITRDSLVARIEGSTGGATRGIDFPLHRIACPG